MGNSSSKELHRAAEGGDAAACARLIESGVSVDAPFCDSRETPLMGASFNGHAPIVRFLLAKGADANKTNAFGRTALARASYRGWTEIVGLLLEAGADIDKANSGGETPLLSALRQGHRATTERLLAAGADARRRSAGTTPLNVAVSYAASMPIGHGKELAAMLLAHGADVDAVGDSGTPLWHAVVRRQGDIVALLLEWGAVVDRWHASGATALIHAAGDGVAGIVALLASHGADSEAASRNGTTALFHAACGDASRAWSGSSTGTTTVLLAHLARVKRSRAPFAL